MQAGPTIGGPRYWPYDLACQHIERYSQVRPRTKVLPNENKAYSSADGVLWVCATHTDTMRLREWRWWQRRFDDTSKFVHPDYAWHI